MSRISLSERNGPVVARGGKGMARLVGDNKQTAATAEKILRHYHGKFRGLAPKNTKRTLKRKCLTVGYMASGIQGFWSVLKHLHLWAVPEVRNDWIAECAPTPAAKPTALGY